MGCVARVLIVEGAQRGLLLAQELIGEGHAVRVVASDPSRRADIEAGGAECFHGTPYRLATLRGALEHVTVACWLLADVGGEDGEQASALHGSRLEQFLASSIDSTLRGFVYEAAGGCVPADVLGRGERIVSVTGARNSIPVAMLRADTAELEEWLAQARAAVSSLLEGEHTHTDARYADSHTHKSRSAFDNEVSTQEDS
jgi:hypothetical protein